MADQTAGRDEVKSPSEWRFVEVVAKFGIETINNPDLSQQEKLEVAKSLLEDILKDVDDHERRESRQGACAVCFTTFNKCVTGHQEPYQACWNTYQDCKRLHGCQ